MNIKRESTAIDKHSNMVLASHMFEIGSPYFKIEIPKNVGFISMRPKSSSFLRENNNNNRTAEIIIGP